MRDLGDEAYLELRRRGMLGEAGAELLAAVVESVAGAHSPSPSYPNLNEEWTWSDADVCEAANEFYAHLGESGKLNTLAVEAADGATLERGLRVRCRSWLQDRAKATSPGAFVRKINDALRRGREEGELCSVGAPEGRAWRRPSDPESVYRGDVQPLLEAAMETEVPPLHYANSSRRDPITDWRGIVQVVVAVLGEAAMAVLARTLHHVGLRRFGIDVRDHEVLDDTHADPYDAFDAALVEMRAAEVVAALESRDLAILGARTAGGVDAVMSLLSVGRSAAEAATKQARERLRDLLSDDIADDRASAWVVAERVLAIAQLRTHVEGSSSAAGRGDA